MDPFALRYLQHQQQQQHHPPPPQYQVVQSQLHQPHPNPNLALGQSVVMMPHHRNLSAPELPPMHVAAATAVMQATPVMVTGAPHTPSSAMFMTMRGYMSPPVLPHIGKPTGSDQHHDDFAPRFKAFPNPLMHASQSSSNGSMLAFHSSKYYYPPTEALPVLPPTLTSPMSSPGSESSDDRPVALFHCSKKQCNESFESEDLLAEHKRQAHPKPKHARKSKSAAVNLDSDTDHDNVEPSAADSSSSEENEEDFKERSEKRSLQAQRTIAGDPLFDMAVITELNQKCQAYLTNFYPNDASLNAEERMQLFRKRAVRLRFLWRRRREQNGVWPWEANDENGRRIRAILAGELKQGGGSLSKQTATVVVTESESESESESELDTFGSVTQSRRTESASSAESPETLDSDTDIGDKVATLRAKITRRLPQRTEEKQNDETVVPATATHNHTHTGTSKGGDKVVHDEDLSGKRAQIFARIKHFLGRRCLPDTKPGQWVCAVCREGMQEAKGLLLRCSGPCAFAYHQSCIELKEIPSGRWWCSDECFRNQSTDEVVACVVARRWHARDFRRRSKPAQHSEPRGRGGRGAQIEKNSWHIERTRYEKPEDIQPCQWTEAFSRLSVHHSQRIPSRFTFKPLSLTIAPVTKASLREESQSQMPHEEPPPPPFPVVTRPVRARRHEHFALKKPRLDPEVTITTHPKRTKLAGKGHTAVASSRSLRSRSQTSIRSAAFLLSLKVRDRDPDHAVCCVCEDGDSLEDNEIILCDGPCSMAYHRYCVGLDAMPAENDEWCCSEQCEKAKRGDTELSDDAIVSLIQKRRDDYDERGPLEDCGAAAQSRISDYFTALDRDYFCPRSVWRAWKRGKWRTGEFDVRAMVQVTNLIMELAQTGNESHKLTFQIELIEDEHPIEAQSDALQLSEQLHSDSLQPSSSLATVIDEMKDYDDCQPPSLPSPDIHASASPISLSEEHAVEFSPDITASPPPGADRLSPPPSMDQLHGPMEVAKQILSSWLFKQKMTETHSQSQLQLDPSAVPVDVSTEQLPATKTISAIDVATVALDGNADPTASMVANESTQPNDFAVVTAGSGTDIEVAAPTESAESAETASVEQVAEVQAVLHAPIVSVNEGDRLLAAYYIQVAINNQIKSQLLDALMNDSLSNPNALPKLCERHLEQEEIIRTYFEHEEKMEMGHAEDRLHRQQTLFAQYCRCKLCMGAHEKAVCSADAERKKREESFYHDTHKVLVQADGDKDGYSEDNDADMKGDEKEEHETGDDVTDVSTNFAHDADYFHLPRQAPALVGFFDVLGLTSAFDAAVRHRQRVLELAKSIGSPEILKLLEASEASAGRALTRGAMRRRSPNGKSRGLRDGDDTEVGERRLNTRRNRALRLQDGPPIEDVDGMSQHTHREMKLLSHWGWDRDRSSSGRRRDDSEGDEEPQPRQRRDRSSSRRPRSSSTKKKKVKRNTIFQSDRDRRRLIRKQRAALKRKHGGRMRFFVRWTLEGEELRTDQLIVYRRPARFDAEETKEAEKEEAVPADVAMDDDSTVLALQPATKEEPILVDEDMSTAPTGAATDSDSLAVPPTTADDNTTESERVKSETASETEVVKGEPTANTAKTEAVKNETETEPQATIVNVLHLQPQQPPAPANPIRPRRFVKVLIDSVLHFRHLPCYLSEGTNIRRKRTKVAKIFHAPSRRSLRNPQDSDGDGDGDGAEADEAVIEGEVSTESNIIRLKISQPFVTDSEHTAARLAARQRNRENERERKAIVREKERLRKARDREVRQRQREMQRLERQEKRNHEIEMVAAVDVDRHGQCNITWEFARHREVREARALLEPQSAAKTTEEELLSEKRTLRSKRSYGDVSPETETPRKLRTRRSAAMEVDYGVETGTVEAKHNAEQPVKELQTLTAEEIIASHTDEQLAELGAVNDVDDDNCSVCQEGGDLLLCDAKVDGRHCTKLWHQQCLDSRKGRGSKAKGIHSGEKFICPYHQCTACLRLDTEASSFSYCHWCEASWCERCKPNKIVDFSVRPTQSDNIRFVCCLSCERSCKEEWELSMDKLDDQASVYRSWLIARGKAHLHYVHDPPESVDEADENDDEEPAAPSSEEAEVATEEAAEEVVEEVDEVELARQRYRRRALAKPVAKAAAPVATPVEPPTAESRRGRKRGRSSTAMSDENVETNVEVAPASESVRQPSAPPAVPTRRSGRSRKSQRLEAASVSGEVEVSITVEEAELPGVLPPASAIASNSEAVNAPMTAVVKAMELEMNTAAETRQTLVNKARSSSSTNGHATPSPKNQRSPVVALHVAGAARADGEAEVDRSTPPPEAAFTLQPCKPRSMTDMSDERNGDEADTENSEALSGVETARTDFQSPSPSSSVSPSLSSISSAATPFAAADPFTWEPQSIATYTSRGRKRARENSAIVVSTRSSRSRNKHE